MALSSVLEKIKAKVLAGERISTEEGLELFHNAPMPELAIMANARRAQLKKDAYEGQGERVITYMIDRNINYTNVCDVYCKFCNFYRTETDADHYVLSHEQIDAKIDPLVAIGGNQILMQGGHHPKLGLDFYLDLLSHIKNKYPQVNIHAFSPPEFTHFIGAFNMPLEEIITRFKEAGLGSIPGGGGEILVDRVRQRISPRKCNSEQWLRVMETAHHAGLRTSATMMYGHVETLDERMEHMRVLRELQDRTSVFMVFICWTFQSAGTVLKPDRKIGSHEHMRMQSVARIFLDNIENMQSSWVTQGPKMGQLGLDFGINDFGGLMMEENVVSQAGSTFRLTLDEMKRLIRQSGYVPHQRDSWYNIVPSPAEPSVAIAS